MNSFPAVVTFVVFLALGASHAQAQTRKPRDAHARGGFLVQTDFEFGGDRIATVDFTDGDSQNVYAGQGLSVGVGGWYRPMESSPFQLQGILGYKFTTTAATNADIHVTRTVLKVNAAYPFADGWFVSAGLTHHIDPQINGDGFFEDISFDNATGLSAEIGWRWVALRYTKMEYSSDFYEDVDASSIGLSVTWRFGNKLGY